MILTIFLQILGFNHFFFIFELGQGTGRTPTSTMPTDNSNWCIIGSPMEGMHSKWQESKIRSNKNAWRCWVLTTAASQSTIMML